MIGKEIYKIYAPSNVKWVEWVRPVPFVAIDIYDRKPMKNWTNRKAFFLDRYEENVAIFVDLPGGESVELGIDLACIGYRPIPLFNGTDEQPGSRATTNTYLVEESLINSIQQFVPIDGEKKVNSKYID